MSLSIKEKNEKIEKLLLVNVSTREKAYQWRDSHVIRAGYLVRCIVIFLLRDIDHIFMA